MARCRTLPALVAGLVLATLASAAHPNPVTQEDTQARARPGRSRAPILRALTLR